MPRSVPFGDIVRGLTPFFVTRQIICGAGRVGLGQDSPRPGYQISQRADFFETEVGLETTIRRPIINTPRRAPRHRGQVPPAPRHHRRRQPQPGVQLPQVRHHALVLSLIEAGLAPKIEVHEPVAALQAVSHDTSLTATRACSTAAGSPPWTCSGSISKPQRSMRRTPASRTRWTGTATPTRSWNVVHHADRTGQRPGGGRVLRGMAGEALPPGGLPGRDGLEWDNARLGLVDLQWADIRPGKGLYYRLLATGPDAANRGRRRHPAAVTEPPSDTRAVLPGTLRQQLRGMTLSGRQLGLGDLRCSRPRQAPAGPHPGAAAGHRGPHRRPVCPAPGGRTVPGRTAGTQPRFLAKRAPAGAPGVAPWLTGCPLPREGTDMKKERTMAGQEQQQPQSRDTEVDEDVPAAPPAPRRPRRQPPPRASMTSSTRSTACWSPTPKSSSGVSSKRAASARARTAAATGCAGTGLRAGSR